MGIHVPPRRRVSLLLLVVKAEYRKYRRRRQPTPVKSVWVVRRSDGKHWAGPYRWQGRTFTNRDDCCYKWGTREAAESAVLWSGIDNVTVQQIH